MEEKREEDFELEFDEDEFDPTKEAFFSDMMEMEEEIASEAYELVEHAINLIETQYYDDGIEILRQAIGLYTQINREAEIKAINEKISEIYVLKEKAFREVEIESEKGIEIIEEPGEIEEFEVSKEAKSEEEWIRKSNQLIVEAQELVNINKFEEAFNKYDEVEKILEDANKPDEIERLYTLIEDCYNKKAEFLRVIKKEEIVEEPVTELEPDEKVSEEQLKEEKLKHFLEAKKREEDISSRAYELLDQAVEMVRIHEYDQALKLYEDGANLFKKLNWTYEIKKIQDTISQLEKEKLKIEEIEKEKLKSEEKIKTELQKEEIVDHRVEEIEEQERLARLERIRGIELQKMEQEFFKAQIDNMATEAARLARNYELAMQKAIKEGNIVEECEYPKVIEIYKRIKELLVEKGWNSEATIYDDTINVYIQKFEQDKKVRQIEAEKTKRKEEAEEVLKVKREDIEIGISEEQQRVIEEQRQIAIEIQNVRNQIDEITDRAERLGREYEVALRKGKFELKCPYSEIINILAKAKQLALERSWDTDVTIISSQINNYREKLEKDKKLRQIEADKARKKIEVEEKLKVKKEEPIIGLDTERLKLIEEQRRLEKEKEDFDSVIEVMINRAEKMAREYEKAMKKAIKKGKLAENPPYLKIIGIYERVNRMLLEKGRKEEVDAYNNQINFYTQKLEQDNKLREVEAQKAEREKALKEMHKVGVKIGVDEEKLKILEKKKEEENFEKFISENVNRAEKMVREHEIAIRKAYRDGEILESTPYAEVIEIYKQLREKVYARGWREQAEIYANQIKIYKEKLEKHEKLLEIEAQKAQKEKDIEEMYKVSKKVEVDEEKIKVIEKKKDEEDFEKFLSENVNRAEKMVREHEIAMRKAYRDGEILESTPYTEVIEIYKQLREKVYARGWREQAEIYANQIRIYQEKLEKHEKLLEIEAQKAEREKAIEEMHKVSVKVEVDQKKLKAVERKKEEKEFEKYITEMVNKGEKLERDFDSAMKKALKKGEVIEQTPYPEIIELYKQLQERVYSRGWKKQSQIYLEQIRIYQEKLEKHEKLLEIEAQKVQKEKELEEMLKAGKKEGKSVKPEKIKEIEAEEKEEDIILDEAMNLIDEAEKAVKSYELSIQKDVLVYQSPYNKAIYNYEEARELFKKIGWNDEANRLINTIKFYKDKKEKDDKLREIEQKKLEKPEIELEVEQIELEKDFIERQKRLQEFEEKQKDADEAATAIFSMIQNAERLAQEYELKLKSGVFDFEAPYEKIIEIYRDARKQFESINWKEESAKLVDTIKFYKEKLAKDKKIRALEAEKVKKREEELLHQQRLLEQERIEKEKLLQERKETLDLKKEKVALFETQKDKAFRLMDQAKHELRENNFEKAIEYYNESENIFADIEWLEGINMVRDSVAMIKNKKKAIEMEQKAAEERKIEELKMEEQLEEKLFETQELRRKQQEEKRKEFLLIQREKERERQISEEAYVLLEEGTALMDRKKFTEAYDKYINARELFKKIFWEREVSRINNELLFKLKREQKKAEILEDVKIKKIEEEKKRAILKEQEKRERKELEKRRKEEKRRLARKELEMEITKKIERAHKLIENFQYNEGVLLLREETERLTKLGKYDDIVKINEQIENIKTEAGIPLITLIVSINDLQNEKFKNAFKALDRAHISVANNQFKKAISELTEAKFKLENLKIGKKILKEIDKKINEFRAKVRKKPIEEIAKVKEEALKDERELLRVRIAARRKERRKKVLDLLGKRNE
ncbi:MAG: hypothetical protein ACFFBV_00650 [Promethearchaeota archaeon]